MGRGAGQDLAVAALYVSMDGTDAAWDSACCHSGVYVAAEAS